ncbi:MAG: hypothetical protein QOI38_1145 [Sphingomonadales bacterium]|jgi:hypothetical protein|nr:hypothetical protein [Sphingomonadales bacterium]
MIRFLPLDVGVAIDAVASDLIGFDWQNRSADFVIPGNEDQVLRIHFETDVIVRMLDEMPLSIESDSSAEEGREPHHFAYKVEGAPFAENRPEAWGEVFGPMNHFQFVTGWGCLDVLTRGEPAFEVVQISR